MGKGYAEVEGVISGQGAQRGHVSGRRRRPSNGKTCTSFAIETLIGKEKGEGEAGRGGRDLGREHNWRGLSKTRLGHIQLKLTNT